MEKYELREGEELIEEYIDNEGNHVTIFKDSSGKQMVGWVISLDDDIIRFFNESAARAGMDPQDYIAFILEEELKRLVEEDEKRKAIEEISD